MKNSKIFLVLMAALVFVGCDQKDVVNQPEAAVSVEKFTYDINESMEVRFTGSADNVVLYTGDKDHNYDLREESNYGLVVNKGVITYAYQQPGTYKVVCVATNHGDYGQTMLQDTCSFEVKVTDDVTEIYNLSASAVLYDEVFAELVGENDWLLGIPTKVRFKGKDMKINIKKQKLKFYIHSGSSQIYVNDALHKNNTQYDLSKALDVKVVSHAGNERNYKLYALNYPEFATFELAGAAATITRNEYDYSYFVVDVTVPAGTDVTNLAPKFTFTGEGEKAYINGTEQVSESTKVDFSQPVTYTLVGKSAENEAIEIKSEFVVNVTVE